MSEIPDTDRPGLAPPQFTMKSLLAVVALLCAASAAVAALGTYGVIAVGLMAIILVAHVAGAAIGHRLRAVGDTPIARNGKAPPPSRRAVRTEEFAPRTQLGDRRAPLLTLLISTGAGALLGALLGGGLLVWLNWERMALGNALFALLAGGLLGGIGGFCSGGFVRVLAGAVFQSLRGASQRSP